jgi:hypothetical protein
MIARADVHHAFQAPLDAAVGRGAWVVGRASGLRLHVAERAIRPYRQGNFGVDVGAAFLIVALGKRTPMPYVWLPRSRAVSSLAVMDVRSAAVFRKNGGSA